MRLQSVIHALYPAQCVGCDAPTQGDHGLCGRCWSQTHFIGGLVCRTCGTPLPGADDGSFVQCDDCIKIARPWDQGRAVLTYEGVGRRMVLALKHGDRSDLVPTFARWMAQKAAELPLDNPLVVPIPLHWTRLVRRRYNQSALLAQALGRYLDYQVCVDALLRPKKTALLEGHTRDARFATLADALISNPARAEVISGRGVLLIDDVMTSGATLAAAAEALQRGGAASASILTLARAVKNP